jgi:pimeloyl-ACP methyl ester carboxylesterase
MDNSVAHKMSPPSALHAATELPRVIQEIAALGLSASWLKKAPRGDGHGVMVLPGFLSSDNANRALIRFLEFLGYEVAGWGQGTNLGPHLEVVENLQTNFEDLAKRSGGKLSLIGHSLGGIYARELARNFPDQVRQVITLGSPFGEGREYATVTGKWYDKLNPDSDELLSRIEEKRLLAEVPPVPTTSVYTRTDGIVSWELSVQQNGHERSENVEVMGSHCGMALNASVWSLLADRLSQQADNWQPFARNTRWRQLLYPRGV